MDSKYYANNFKQFGQLIIPTQFDDVLISNAVQVLIDFSELVYIDHATGH